MSSRTLTVRVSRIQRMTMEVSAFELVHPHGRHLPGYGAGAHIDVHTPGGFMRQYSLALAAQTEPKEATAATSSRHGASGDGGGGGTCTRYLIGVKREPESRGGSAALHERVHEGDQLAVSEPRNTFALDAQARHHQLLAGGIGLTPLLAMAQQLRRDGAAFTLCVFARSRAHVAFAHALAALGPSVRLHFDEPAAGAQAQHLDIPALLARPDPGTHLYLCGPGAFMKAVLAAANSGPHPWPDERVHLEYFAPPEAERGIGTGTGTDSEPFTLVLAGRGIEVPVAADQSAVEALHEIGIDVPTSCSQGMCGTCVVPLASVGAGAGAGTGAGSPDIGDAPDHRDHCLSNTERRHKVALCSSRTKPGGRLVIEWP
jgi:ferredoxin-NADP reductase